MVAESPLDFPFVPSAEDVAKWKERGRLMAAGNMIMNPEARRRVEEAYGKDYCLARYPEVYAAEALAVPELAMPMVD